MAKRGIESRGASRDPKVQVLVGTSGGELYFSRNGGDSWALIHAHLPAIYSVEASVV